MKRIRPAVVFVLAAAAVVPFVDFGGNAPGSGSGSGSGSGAGTTSTAVEVRPPVPSTVTVAPATVTVVGQIVKLLASGEVVVNDGQTDYTVGMSTNTKLVNLNGAEVGREFLQVGASIQVTGTLTGSRIFAPTVVIPTTQNQR